MRGCTATRRSTTRSTASSIDTRACTACREANRTRGVGAVQHRRHRRSATAVLIRRGLASRRNSWTEPAAPWSTRRRFYNLYPKSVFGLLVKADSGRDSVEDLRGQVIGVGTADGAEVSFAQAILTDAGIRKGRIRLGHRLVRVRQVHTSESHGRTHAAHLRAGRARAAASDGASLRHRNDVPAGDAPAVEDHHRECLLPIGSGEDVAPRAMRRRGRGSFSSWSDWARRRMSIPASCRAGWRNARRSAGC